MLERVGCFFFKVNFKNLILIYLWVFLCIKVSDNDVLKLNSDATTQWYQNPGHFEFNTQHGTSMAENAMLSQTTLFLSLNQL